MNRVLKWRLVSSLVATGAIGAVGALGACYSSPHPATYAYVTTGGPPGDRTEVITVSPGANYVWVGGRWAYRNNNYEWVPGAWAVPAVGFTRWEPGRWDHDGHGWFYRDGHWR